MPDQLDSKGTQAAIHRILQALAAGHLGARRAAVLLYGIQMSSGQMPQIPILKPPIKESRIHKPSGDS